MVGVSSNKDKEVHKWSDKKMGGGDEGFNTVQCLRGRLLAERHASKVANEEVESICNKLIELEKKLREEIRLREKAERRLKYLKKKLESFNVTGESDQSYSSHSSMHKFSKDGDSHPCCHFQRVVCENPNTNSRELKSDESMLSISSSKSSTKDSIALSTDDYSSSSTNSSSGDSSLENYTHNRNPSSTNVKKEESKC